MAHVALGGFQYGVDKFFDKIPERTFSGETYKPAAIFGKNGKKSRNRDSRRDSIASRDSRGSADYDEQDQRQGRYRSEQSDGEEDDEEDEQRNTRSSRDKRRQRGDSSREDDYEQSNPNFPVYAQRRSKHQQDQRDGPADRNEQSYKPSSRAVGLSTMNQDSHYPAPPGQTYHRYNPADYRPQDAQQQQQHPAAYAPYAAVAYQDPYARPNSTGGHRDDRRDERRDDRRDERRDDRHDDRRGRDKEKERRRRTEKSRTRAESRSVSPHGVKGLMHKSLDTTERGLTTGAIGAIAGGLIANEVGKSPLATLAGVVLGGLGANVWEAKDSKKKAERRSDKDRGDNDRGSKGRVEGSSRRAHSEGRDRDQVRGDGSSRQHRRNSVYYEDNRGQNRGYGNGNRQRGGYDNSESDHSRSEFEEDDKRRGGNRRPRREDKRDRRRGSAKDEEDD